MILAAPCLQICFDLVRCDGLMPSGSCHLPCRIAGHNRLAAAPKLPERVMAAAGMAGDMTPLRSRETFRPELRFAATALGMYATHQRHVQP